MAKAGFIALLFASTAAFAAVPVEERGNSASNKPAAGPTTGLGPPARVYRSEESSDDRGEQEPAASASGLAMLFNELQMLRGEVQELRGVVETQNYRLKQLEQRQSEQYQDLDRRVASLSTRPAPPSGEAKVDEKSGGGNTSAAPSGGDSESGQRLITRSTNIPGNEKDAYAAAFDAMKARQFDSSIDQFSVFVKTYPNGDLTPNAFYWLGELHLANTDTEQARQSFAQLINLYPKHQKVPDAMYKMGVVYHRLGDNSRALDYLTRVRDTYPDSSAAGLADTYAAELE